MVKALVGEGILLEISEPFVKELDVVLVEWDPESCRWLRRDCDFQP